MERINLRSVISYSLLPALTVSHAVPAMALARAGGHLGPELFSRSYYAAARLLAGARLHVEQSPHLDPRRTYVFVANHRSYLDVPCVCGAWPGPIRFVAKRELFAIPVFGRAMEAVGHIPVDRGRSDQARASLARAVEPVRSRVSVLFFAEGTRNPTDTLLPFKKGFLNLAEAAQVPVVPVGIAGAGEILPKGSLALTPGDVGVVFGDPVEGAEDPNRDRDQRLSEVRDAVASAVARAWELRPAAVAAR